MSTQSTDALRLTVAALNLIVWAPWLVLVPYAAANPIQLMYGLGVAAPGVALAVICARGRARWELHALIPLVLLIVWVVVLLSDISTRPLHAESGCFLCSLVDWRIRTGTFLIGRGNYLLAFDVLWYDFALPATAILSPILIGVRLASRLWRSGAAREANAT